MDKRPQQGDTFPLTIDGYASDGSGVGRLEGMVVFVPGALRGEVCQVQLTHVGRSALWGRVKTILTPSPARIPPDCPYDAQCGGCRFRHMDYAEELQAKRARVEDALCRIGRRFGPGGGRPGRRVSRALPQQGPVPGRRRGRRSAFTGSTAIRWWTWRTACCKAPPPPGCAPP